MARPLYVPSKTLTPCLAVGWPNRHENSIMSGLMCYLGCTYEDVIECNYSQQNGGKKGARKGGSEKISNTKKMRRRGHLDTEGKWTETTSLQPVSPTWCDNGKGRCESKQGMSWGRKREDMMTPVCQECLQCTSCVAGKPRDQVPRVSCCTRLFPGLTLWYLFIGRERERERERGMDGGEDDWNCSKTGVGVKLENSSVKGIVWHFWLIAFLQTVTWEDWYSSHFCLLNISSWLA